MEGTRAPLRARTRRAAAILRCGGGAGGAMRRGTARSGWPAYPERGHPPPSAPPSHSRAARDVWTVRAPASAAAAGPDRRGRREREMHNGGSEGATAAAGAAPAGWRAAARRPCDLPVCPTSPLARPARHAAASRGGGGGHRTVHRRTPRPAIIAPGHRVTPLLTRRARRAAATQPAPLFSSRTGTAREMPRRPPCQSDLDHCSRASRGRRPQ
jgi:hypothetical protein